MTRETMKHLLAGASGGLPLILYCQLMFTDLSNEIGKVSVRVEAVEKLLTDADPCPTNDYDPNPCPTND